MTVDQIIQLLSTQGLALILVIGGALWGVRVLIPRYLDSIKSEVTRAAMEAKQSLAEQTRSINEQTRAIETHATTVTNTALDAKKGLEEQTERITEQTHAIEVLTVIQLHAMQGSLSPEQFEKMLVTIRALSRKANGTIGVSEQ